MPQSYTRMTRLLFSLLVAGGLAFGTQAAFANAAPASSCPHDPDNGAIGLSCTPGTAGNAFCDQQCKAIFGSGSPGFCNRVTGCCVCGV